MIRAALLTLCIWCAALPAAAFDVDTITDTRSGLSAYLISEPSVPLVSISFSSKGGSTCDPAGKEGVAFLMSGLLNEGAGDMDALTFQTTMEDYGIKLDFSASLDGMSGMLVVPTTHLDKGLELMRLALTEPRFDPEPVERVRKQIELIINKSRTTPASRANEDLMAAMFAGHPYARPGRGTVASVRAITSDDLRTALNRLIVRDSLYIGIAGDIDAATATAALGTVFGGLPARADDPCPAVPEVTASTAAQTITIPLAVRQAVALLAQPGLKRNDPDWYAAQVMDYSLGGGVFMSRLFDDVRVKRGLAYSVGTKLAPMEYGALYYASVGTAAESLNDSLAAIRANWEKMAAEGPTDQEVADAKQYLTGSFALQFSNTGTIAATLAAIQREGLGQDYLEKRNSYIEAVTPEHARAVASRLLKPDALTVIIVAPPTEE